MPLFKSCHSILDLRSGFIVILYGSFFFLNWWGSSCMELPVYPDQSIPYIICLIGLYLSLFVWSQCALDLRFLASWIFLWWIFSNGEKEIRESNCKTSSTWTMPHIDEIQTSSMSMDPNIFLHLFEFKQKKMNKINSWRYHQKNHLRSWT